jgi:hypothetical protein
MEDTRVKLKLLSSQALHSEVLQTTQHHLSYNQTCHSLRCSNLKCHRYTVLQTPSTQHKPRNDFSTCNVLLMLPCCRCREMKNVKICYWHSLRDGRRNYYGKLYFLYELLFIRHFSRKVPTIVTTNCQY